MKPSRGGPRPGFTLIELMIVVAIIGVLASVAVPKFAELLRKAKEGSTKGSLGQFRSALSIYYGDNEGHYPTGGAVIYASPWSGMATLLLPKYIDKIPAHDFNKYHAPGNAIYLHTWVASGDFHDGSGWGYDGTMASTRRGSIWAYCSHTDTKGSSWSTY